MIMAASICIFWHSNIWLHSNTSVLLSIFAATAEQSCPSDELQVLVSPVVSRRQRLTQVSGELSNACRRACREAHEDESSIAAGKGRRRGRAWSSLRADLSTAPCMQAKTCGCDRRTPSLHEKDARQGSQASLSAASSASKDCPYPSARFQSPRPRKLWLIIQKHIQHARQDSYSRPSEHSRLVFFYCLPRNCRLCYSVLLIGRAHPSPRPVAG